MSKLWHTQVILLLSGERPLVHRGSKDKVQSQHLESLGTGALSAYFATNFITRLFSQSGAAPSYQAHERSIQRDVLSVSWQSYCSP